MTERTLRMDKYCDEVRKYICVNMLRENVRFILFRVHEILLTQKTDFRTKREEIQFYTDAMEFRCFLPYFCIGIAANTAKLWILQRVRPCLVYW